MNAQIDAVKQAVVMAVEAHPQQDIGHFYKLRSSQAQTMFGPAKALGPKE